MFFIFFFFAQCKHALIVNDSICENPKPVARCTFNYNTLEVLDVKNVLTRKKKTLKPRVGLFVRVDREERKFFFFSS